jgi:hypothetical protein
MPSQQPSKQVISQQGHADPREGIYVQTILAIEDGQIRPQAGPVVTDGIVMDVRQ